MMEYGDIWHQSWVLIPEMDLDVLKKGLEEIPGHHARGCQF